MPQSSLSLSNPFINTAKKVIKESPEIQIAVKDKKIAITIAKKALSQYLPQVSGTIDGSIISEEYEDSLNEYNELSSTLSISQDIVNVQKIYAIKAAKRRIKFAEEKLRQIKQEVLIKYALAWISYWKALRQMEISEENVRILDKYRKKSKVRYDVGELTITDVRLAKTRFQGALYQKSRFARDLYRAKKVLKEMIKTSVPDQVKLFRFIIDKKSLHDINTLIANHPAIKPMLSELSALEFDIKQQRSAHLPTLELYSSYKYQLEGEYSESKYPYQEGSIGFEVNIPLYSGGSINHSTSEVIKRKQQQVLKIKQVKDTLLRDIRSSIFDLEESVREIKIALRQLGFANETLKGMNQEFDMGSRTSTDVFLVQADMINSKLALISAKEQHARFLMNYLYAIGKLDIAFLKSLPKQSYLK